MIILHSIRFLIKNLCDIFNKFIKNLKFKLTFQLSLFIIYFMA